MEIKYVTSISDNKLKTSGILGKTYIFNGEEELLDLVNKFIDEGYPFASEISGWPPSAILEELQLKGLLTKPFKAITWTNPSNYRVFEITTKNSR
jgi:hypothetical protein